MKVYFVRHGESEGNTSPFQQDASSPLSEYGRQQATIVADRFTNIIIESIIASPYPRAKETAEIISSHIGKPVVHSNLFVERRRPSEEIGKTADDPIVVRLKDLTRENIHNDSWRYSDEENFEDLKKRGLSALDYLIKTPHENVLVVTHGMFLRAILSCMLLGDKLTKREYFNIMISFEMENTGVTLCEYQPVIPNIRDNPWRIVAWNDHAHLG